MCIGDTNVFLAARSAARDGFESNRTLSSGSPEAAKQIEHAEAVAKILRENIVQGQALDEQGERYSKEPGY